MCSARTRSTSDHSSCRPISSSGAVRAAGGVGGRLPQNGERMSTASEPPIHLAGTALGKHRHVCAFFHSREEEYQVLLPFICEGFARGEKAFHIIDPAFRA